VISLVTALIDPLLKVETMFKTYSLNRMLGLLATAGFAFLLADTILEHRDILMKESASWIPVFFSAVAFCISAIAIVRWNAGWKKAFRIVLISSVFIGIGGVYAHIPDDDRDQKSTSVQQQKPEENDKDKPILAPLSFAGVAAIGLLGLSKKWRPENA
jgi:hypothetical protein